MKEYQYLVSFGSEKQSLTEKLCEIEEIQSVEYFLSDGRNAIKYFLNDDVDEYGVFVKVCEIVQGDGEDIGFMGEELASEQPETEAEKSEEVHVQTVGEMKKEEKKKKKLSLSDSYLRIAEVVISFLLYCIFGVDKLVPTCICLAIVAYEIFFDAINAITAKKFTDDIAVSLTLIFLVAGAFFKICFFTALIYSVIKIVYGETVKLLKRKNSPYSSLEKMTINDTLAGVESVKKGDRFILVKEAYFDCEIVDGEGELEVDGKVSQYKKGDSVPFGAKVTEVNSFIVKSKENYHGSKLCKAIEREKENMKKVEEMETSSKTTSVISVALLLATVVAAIVLTVASEASFFRGVAYWLSRFSPITVFCAPLCNFFYALSNQAFYYSLCKKSGLDGDVSTLINFGDSIVYDENALSEDGVLYEDAYGILRELKDLGVSEQICVSRQKSDTLESVCEQLKLKRFINGISDDEFARLIKDKVYVCNRDGQVTVYRNGEILLKVNSRLREIPQALRQVKNNLKIKKVVRVLSAVTFVACAVTGVALVLGTLSAITLGFLLTTLFGAINLFQLVK